MQKPNLLALVRPGPYGDGHKDSAGAATVSQADVIHCRNFYIYHHISTICRDIVMGVIFKSGHLQISWGRNDEHVASAQYSDRVRETMIEALDCMYCYGFVPWKPAKFVTKEGLKVYAPLVIDPSEGVSTVYREKSGRPRVAFQTQQEPAKQKSLPVYVFPMYRPTIDGVLRSPVRGILMNFSYVQQLQNMDAMAMSALSRPPLVYECVKDPTMDGPTYDRLSNGIAPEVPHPSQVSPYYGRRGPSQLPTDPTAMVQSAEYLSDVNETVRQIKNERYGSTLAVDGSDQFVPDPLSGTLPMVGYNVGQFHKNEHFMEAGYRLVHQEMPQRYEKLEDQMDRMDRLVCAMWGVPMIFLNIQAVAYKDDVTWLTQALFARIERAVSMVCAAIAAMLNDMFKDADDRRRKLRYVLRRVDGTPPESEEMQQTLEEALEPHEYRVSMTFDRSIGLQEIAQLKMMGLKNKTAANLLAEHYALSEDDFELTAPAAAPAPAAQDARPEHKREPSEEQRPQEEEPASKRERKEEEKT